jgi:hypothetical protein
VTPISYVSERWAMSFRPAELRQRAVVNRPVLTSRVASADDSLMMITLTLARPVRLALDRRYRRQVTV